MICCVSKLKGTNGLLHLGKIYRCDTGLERMRRQFLAIPKINRVAH